MTFGFRHDQFGGLIDAVVLAIPIDDDAIDPAADHVGNLIMDLIGICRAVPDVHVVRSTEPQQEMSVNLGGRSRIEQGVDVDLAHIASA